jgi:two-component system chemotaxis sensor kinase CheA
MTNGMETYREEALELLADLEAALLELEQNPSDPETVSRIFRDVHTIKGSGAMFGLEDITNFTHQVETVFDAVRNGGVRVTPHLISLTLEAQDQIRGMLEARFGGTAPDPGDAADLVKSFAKIWKGSAEDPAIPAVADSSPAGPQETRTWRIRFRPPLDVFRTGTNPAMLFGELRAMGDADVFAHTSSLPALEEIDAEQCYLRWEIVLTTDQPENAIRDVFIFVADASELSIETISEDPESDAHRPIGEILVERGDLDRGVLNAALERHRRLGEELVDAGEVHPEQVEAAILEQRHRNRVRAEVGSPRGASIRVDAGKMDSLVNAVGELVTTQARLSQFAAACGDTELQFLSEEVERLTEKLRGDTMSMRMLPIGETFGRFRRLVRDLSRDLNKDIELVAEGEETEVDKNVLERLHDPLVHLIRNAADHGIEAPEARQRAGKTRRGTIKLSAAHSGAHVLVRVADDGAGLDRDTILQRAIARGMISSEAGGELSEQEVFALILEPGFSTTREVTQFSGRGVGMDVVARNVSLLRGALEIASGPGAGTTITLKLPLTLAIIDGLLVSAGDDHFVFPLSNILECVELERRQEHHNGRQFVTIRQELVPYIVLRDYFSIGGSPPMIEQVLIADTGHGRVGIAVDRVIGHHQTVIKNLGGLYQEVQSVSGATILADGRLALILDVEKLVYEAVTPVHG